MTHTPNSSCSSQDWNRPRHDVDGWITSLPFWLLVGHSQQWKTWKLIKYFTGQLNIYTI